MRTCSGPTGDASAEHDPGQSVHAGGRAANPQNARGKATAEAAGVAKHHINFLDLEKPVLWAKARARW